MSRNVDGEELCFPPTTTTTTAITTATTPRNHFKSLDNIDIEDLEEAEHDLSFEEVVSLGFLLYGDDLANAEYILQRLLILFRQKQEQEHGVEEEEEQDEEQGREEKEMEETCANINSSSSSCSNRPLSLGTVLFVPYARLNPSNWRSTIIEALAIVRSKRVLRKLGFHWSDLRTHYLPHIPQLTLRLHPILKALYCLSEQLSFQQSAALIEYMIEQQQQQQTEQEQQQSSNNNNNNNNNQLNFHDPYYLEIYLLYWIAQHLIRIGDRNCLTTNLQPLIDYFQLQSMDEYKLLLLETIKYNRRHSSHQEQEQEQHQHQDTDKDKDQKEGNDKYLEKKQEKIPEEKQEKNQEEKQEENQEEKQEKNREKKQEKKQEKNREERQGKNQDENQENDKSSRLLLASCDKTRNLITNDKNNDNDNVDNKDNDKVDNVDKDNVDDDSQTLIIQRNRLYKLVNMVKCLTHDSPFNTRCSPNFFNHIRARNVEIDRYLVRYSSAGYILIINQNEFYQEQDADLQHLLPPHPFPRYREGTNVDRDRLSSLFRLFGYQSIVLENLTHRDILQEIRNVVQKSLHRDSLIVAILTHGAKDVVYGNNSIPVYLNDIQEIMSDSSLKGKPKMLIIQACQKEHFTAMGDVARVVLRNAMPTTVDDCYADMLVALSALPGSESLRNTLKGSWYIESLCDVLEKFGNCKHMVDILTVVTNAVTNKNHREFMLPLFRSTLRKDFYLPEIPIPSSVNGKAFGVDEGVGEEKKEGEAASSLSSDSQLKTVT